MRQQYPLYSRGPGKNGDIVCPQNLGDVLNPDEIKRRNASLETSENIVVQILVGEPLHVTSLAFGRVAVRGDLTEPIPD